MSQKLGNKVQITGCAFSTPEIPLDCGNSGTSIRLLAGLLSGKGIYAEFIGDISIARLLIAFIATVKPEIELKLPGTI